MAGDEPRFVVELESSRIRLHSLVSLGWMGVYDDDDDVSSSRGRRSVDER